MGMCKKQMLSFILTLALVVGCFAGTGITVKAVGSSILQGTVVDENGDPVSDVEFQLKSNNAQIDKTVIIICKNGQIEYDVKDLVDCEYRLTVLSEDWDSVHCTHLIAE